MLKWLTKLLNHRRIIKNLRNELDYVYENCYQVHKTLVKNTMLMDINEADNNMGFMIHIRKEASTVHSVFLSREMIPNVTAINQAISNIYQYLAKNSIPLPFDRSTPGKEKEQEGGSLN